MTLTLLQDLNIKGISFINPMLYLDNKIVEDKAAEDPIGCKKVVMLVLDLLLKSPKQCKSTFEITHTVLRLDMDLVIPN